MRGAVLQENISFLWWVQCLHCGWLRIVRSSQTQGLEEGIQVADFDDCQLMANKRTISVFKKD